MRLSGKSAVVVVLCVVVAGVIIAALEELTDSASKPAAGANGGANAAARPNAALPYSLAATRRCLTSGGFAITKITSRDPRLRALGDLAQRASLEVHRGEQTLGLAFGDTRLLADLLQVPNDPYRLEVRRNALLMYRPAARNEAAAVRDCLRP